MVWQVFSIDSLNFVVVKIVPSAGMGVNSKKRTYDIMPVMISKVWNFISKMEILKWRVENLRFACMFHEAADLLLGLATPRLNSHVSDRKVDQRPNLAQVVSPSQLDNQVSRCFLELGDLNDVSHFSAAFASVVNQLDLFLVVTNKLLERSRRSASLEIGIKRPQGARCLMLVPASWAFVLEISQFSRRRPMFQLYRLLLITTSLQEVLLPPSSLPGRVLTLSTLRIEGGRVNASGSPMHTLMFLR